MDFLEILNVLSKFVPAVLVIANYLRGKKETRKNKPSLARRFVFSCEFKFTFTIK